MSHRYLASALPDHEVAELYRLMAEEIRECAVFLMNPEGIISVWNKAAEELKGYTAEEAIGEFLGLLYTDEDRAKGRPQHNLKAAAEDGYYQEETWRRRKDGSLFWARIALTALRDDTGRLLGFSKITFDLTHHKELEQCQNEKAEIHRILQAAEAGTWKWDVQTDRIVTSPFFLQLLGYSETEMVADFDRLIDLVHPADRDHARRRLCEMRDTSFSRPLMMELRLSRKDGTPCWFFMRAQWSSESGEAGVSSVIAGVNVNIAALKEAEAKRESLSGQLQNERIRFSAILEQMPSGVMLAESPSGKLIYQNRAATEMFGRALHATADNRDHDRYQLKNPLGQSLRNEEYPLIRAVREGQATRGEEVAYQLPDGSLRYFSVTAAPVFDADGIARVAVAVFHDVSRLKQVQASLAAETERALVTLSAITDGVVTTDLQAVVKSLNPAGERLTGWSEAEALGHRVGDLFRFADRSNEDVLLDSVRRCIEECRTVQNPPQINLLGKDGREYSIESSSAPIRLGDGSVIGAVLVFHDVTEARGLVQKLGYQASHDELTGLVNRREFAVRLQRTIDRARCNPGKPAALLYMDLDQFKIVNDTCGHSAGDELLRQLAKTYVEHVRERDTLARIGGDEFALIVEHCTLDEASAVANKMLDITKNFRYACKGRMFQLGVSIGLIPIDDSATTVEKTLQQADHACYLAKEHGRNRVYLEQSGDADMAQRRSDMHWVARLGDAFHNEQLQLFSQPIIALGDDPPGSHYEILLRLKNGDRGLISPMTFLPAAERYDVMPSVDRWVLKSALKWLEDHPQHVAGLTMCSINLSRRTLADGSFQKYAADLIGSATVPPEKLCFEITENGAIANMQKTISFIDTLAGLGCKFSLDDFGTGMTSFSYLKQLPVDFIKIDGSLIQMMASSRIDYEMVRFTNEISHMMGRKTIAEYVSGPAILDNLRLLGVDFAQGYWIGKPEPLTA